MIDPTSKLLQRFSEHLPLNSTDRTLVVLKGHLLVEEMLRQYVDQKFDKPEELAAARLTFQQCLCLARAFESNPLHEKLWLSVEKLNNLRNKLAHSLEPKNIDAHIKEFLYLLSNFEILDEERKFGALTSCVLAICLSLSHAVHGN